LPTLKRSNVIKLPVLRICVNNNNKYAQFWYN
jgi:hypothetical protein